MYYLTRNTIHNNIVCLPSKCSLGAITEDLCQKIGKMNPLKRKSFSGQIVIHVLS